MTLSPITGLVLNRSFVASLLLTGSAALAEVAILNAIDAIDPKEISNEALFRRVTIAAIAVGSVAARDVHELGEPSPALPIELNRVFCLPTDLRQCFVLRILAGLSREDSAHMLCVSPHLLDERAGAAAAELAAVRQAEFSDPTTGRRSRAAQAPLADVDKRAWASKTPPGRRRGQ
jgi:hypothetical protein